MVGWRDFGDNVPSVTLDGEVPSPLDRDQRRQDSMFECQQLLREFGISAADMDILAKQPDLALRVLAYLELHEGTSPTEAMLAVVQEADIRVTGESVFDWKVNQSNQFHIQVDGMSFGQTSRLKRKMWDEAE